MVTPAVAVLVIVRPTNNGLSEQGHDDDDDDHDRVVRGRPRGSNDSTLLFFPVVEHHPWQPGTMASWTWYPVSGTERFLPEQQQQHHPHDDPSSAFQSSPALSS